MAEQQTTPLSAAAQAGDISLYEQQQKTPQEKLNEAAQAGDINLLYGCIQDDPHILDGINKIPYVDTPLHIAASAGHAYFALEMVRLMPSFGKKLNPQGLSPLDLALQNGHSDTVSQLINFDKELIRVKGRESFTPLHYVAKIGDVDLLAEFLCVCPESIRDQTIRNETAVHIAVVNRNLEAFKVLLGWLRRINKRHVLSWKNDKGNTVLHIAVFTLQPQIVQLLVEEIKKESKIKIELVDEFGKYKMNKNGRNLEGLTALDVAESLDDGVVKTEIVNALRCAGASGRSSLDKFYSLAEFLMSGERFWEREFGFIFRVQRDMSMEMRNMILVVAVLIATATFQAVLSPSGGLPDNHNLPTNNTITVAANTTSANPFKRVLFNGPKFTNENFFLFYSLNTLCFTASVTVIIIVLPFQIINVYLYVALMSLMLSYGLSFLFISPSFLYALMSMVFSYSVGVLASITKFRFSINELRCMAEGNVPLMSHSQLEMSRIQILRRLVHRP